MTGSPMDCGSTGAVGGGVLVESIGIVKLPAKICEGTGRQAVCFFSYSLSSLRWVHDGRAENKQKSHFF